jgi:acetylornithine deacetylase/succinyl-diaminopimelate desuccinylase family protein
VSILRRLKTVKMGKREVLLEAVEREEILKLTQELVAIPSPNPPGKEKDVALYLTDLFREMGLKVEMKEVCPDRPNVIAVWDSGRAGPTVMLNGHMDVVPPGDGWTVEPYSGKIVDGRLYGRGSTDMKGGVAAMIMALKAVRDSGLEVTGRVILAAVVGEEVDQAGIRKLVEDGIEADCAIITEPTNLKPVIAHQGDLHYRITTIGKAAHSSMPHLGVNAIEKMCMVIKGLHDVKEGLVEKSHPLLGQPTLSVGTIEGGLDTCVVPSGCTITVDRRVNPGEPIKEADRELEEMLDRLRGSDPQLRVELSRFLTAPAMEMSPRENVALSIRRATEAVTGKDPGFHGLPGTCDANYLVNVAGIPTVIFGPGPGSVAHQPDEYVEIEKLVETTQILALALFDLLE